MTRAPQALGQGPAGPPQAWRGIKVSALHQKSREALVPNNSGVGGSDTAIIVSPLDGYQVTALRQD